MAKQQIYRQKYRVQLANRLKASKIAETNRNVAHLFDGFTHSLKAVSI